MISLTLAAPAWVVLATPVAVGVRLVRRQPIKSAYNISIYTLAWAAGAAIVAVAGPATDSLRGLTVLALAGAVGGLISHVAVALVISVAQETSFTASWRAGAGLQVLSTLGNVAVALVVVVLARHDPRLIAAAACLALCAHQGYVGRLRGREERTAAARQLHAVNALAADLDEAAVTARAAAEIATLLAADAVEIDLAATAAGPGTVYQHRRRADAWAGLAGQAPPVAGRLVAEIPIIGSGEPVGRIRVWLAGGSAGYLRLSERDQVALRTLAAATHTALANARAHAQQTYQATHDRITDLPTHDVLLTRIDQHLADVRAGRADGPIALAVIDITDFREIVRTLGRPAAHRLLTHAADRLRATVVDGEFVAHVGSDSFAVYLHPAGQPDPLPAPAGALLDGRPGWGDPERIHGRVLALVNAIADPVRLEAGAAQVSLPATAGIAYSDTPAASGAELLRQATVALDDARNRVNTQVGWYDPGADVAGPSALILASALRAALDRDELELHYQPILHLTEGWPVAVEALIRWRHPTRGLLRPSQFVPVLQRSPRDHAALVRWYLDHALRERAHWGADLDLPIAVNLDARALLDRDLVGRIAAALSAADLPPSQLICELTETAALSPLDTVDWTLADLRALGVGVAIDDFGAGHSSLTRLLRVPATSLKIAAELVNDLLVSDQAEILIRAAVDIAHHQGLQVSALGVTTTAQANALVELGCPAAQGRHLVRPLTSGPLRDFLNQAPPRPADHAADIIPLQTRRSATSQPRST